MSTITGLWKIVYGSYLVSSDGDVYSCRRGRLLKPTFNKQVRYLYVNLGRKRREYVHRLVLLAFRGPPSLGEVGDHINGDRANNSLSNLRYLQKIDNDRQGNRTRCKYTPHIPAIRRLRGTISAKAVADRYGIRSVTTIRNIWANKTWPTGKFKPRNLPC